MMPLELWLVTCAQKLTVRDVNQQPPVPNVKQGFICWELELMPVVFLVERNTIRPPAVLTLVLNAPIFAEYVPQVHVHHAHRDTI